MKQARLELGARSRTLVMVAQGGSRGPETDPPGPWLQRERPAATHTPKTRSGRGDRRAGGENRRHGCPGELAPAPHVRRTRLPLGLLRHIPPRQRPLVLHGSLREPRQDPALPPATGPRFQLTRSRMRLAGYLPPAGKRSPVSPVPQRPARKPRPGLSRRGGHGVRPPSGQQQHPGERSLSAYLLQAATVCRSGRFGLGRREGRRVQPSARTDRCRPRADSGAFTPVLGGALMTVGPLASTGGLGRPGSGGCRPRSRTGRIAGRSAMGSGRSG